MIALKQSKISYFSYHCITSFANLTNLRIDGMIMSNDVYLFINIPVNYGSHDAMTFMLVFTA